VKPLLLPRESPALHPVEKLFAILLSCPSPGERAIIMMQSIAAWQTNAYSRLIAASTAQPLHYLIGNCEIDFAHLLYAACDDISRLNRAYSSWRSGIQQVTRLQVVIL